MTSCRLSKVIAGSGIASRRSAEELILRGEVTVNGKKCLVPQTMVDPETDIIKHKGKPVAYEQKQYFVVNKPKGYVSTSLSTGKSKRVIDLIDSDARLFTIGRLDKDTQGLIIVTNDGHFANSIAHPSNEVPKEYLVKVDKEILHEHLVKMSEGTAVEGKWVVPVSVKKVRRGTMKVVVLDGRKHEVRILCDMAGLNVLELTRIRIGHIVLGTLPVGAYRALTLNERKAFS